MDHLRKFDLKKQIFVATTPNCCKCNCGIPIYSQLQSTNFLLNCPYIIVKVSLRRKNTLLFIFYRFFLFLGKFWRTHTRQRMTKKVSSAVVWRFSFAKKNLKVIFRVTNCSGKSHPNLENKNGHRDKPPLY